MMVSPVAPIEWFKVAQRFSHVFQHRQPSGLGACIVGYRLDAKNFAKIFRFSITSKV
jgi:hypothetical protein